jgi:hypothetical protein
MQLKTLESKEREILTLLPLMTMFVGLASVVRTLRKTSQGGTNSGIAFPRLQSRKDHSLLQRCGKASSQFLTANLEISGEIAKGLKDNVTSTSSSLQITNQKQSFVFAFLKTLSIWLFQNTNGSNLRDCTIRACNVRCANGLLGDDIRNRALGFIHRKSGFRSPIDDVVTLKLDSVFLCLTNGGCQWTCKRGEALTHCPEDESKNLTTSWCRRVRDKRTSDTQRCPRNDVRSCGLGSSSAKRGVLRSDLGITQ